MIVCYFVKHRRRRTGKECLRLEQTTNLCRGGNDLAIRRISLYKKKLFQQPFQDRKFVLRSHIVMVHRSRRRGNAIERDIYYVVRPPILLHRPCPFCTRKSLFSNHASSYQRGDSADRATHICQAGKRLPLPILASRHCDGLLSPSCHERLSSYVGMQPSPPTCFLQPVRFKGCCRNNMRPPRRQRSARFQERQQSVHLRMQQSSPALGWGPMSNVP